MCVVGRVMLTGSHLNYSTCAVTGLSQEKLKGKNKLVPRLLGITKDSVVRVDEKTKEVCWLLITEMKMT